MKDKNETETNYLSKEILISLLQHNSEKMNFQHNMIFQIRNWEIVITLGIISVAWSFELIKATGMIFCYQLIIQISIHLIVIFILLRLKRKENGWYNFFVIFRNRVKLIEEIVLYNKEMDEDKFLTKYHEILPINEAFPKKKKIREKNIHKEYDKGAFILISLLVVSLVLKITWIICLNF